jgi:hypothetical protein
MYLIKANFCKDNQVEDQETIRKLTEQVRELSGRNAELETKLRAATVELDRIRVERVDAECSLSKKRKLDTDEATCTDRTRVEMLQKALQSLQDESDASLKEIFTLRNGNFNSMGVLYRVKVEYIKV